MLVLMAEGSIHCGVGQDFGAVDLPIQRDPVTRTPVIYGSSLKGALRDDVHRAEGRDRAAALFGPRVDGDNPGELERGKVGPGEARLLLYPVATARGLFAFVTCPSELSRFSRVARALGVDAPVAGAIPSPEVGEALLTSGDVLLDPAAGGNGPVALRDHVVTGRTDAAFTEFADQFADRCLPDCGDDYWKAALRARSVLVHDDVFRALVDPAVVVMRVQLEPDTKIVKPGALFSEEVLPADSVLWAPFNGEAPAFETLVGMLGERPLITVGGGETIGFGACRVRALEGQVPA